MPSVGEKYKFSIYNIDRSSPICEFIRAAAHLHYKIGDDYEKGFEVIEVGKFITIKFFNTEIEIKFPAEYWNVLTFCPQDGGDH